MCCRYYVDESPVLEEIAEAVNRAPLTEKITARLGKKLKTAGEIRPADLAPVLATARGGGRAAFPMVWGFSGRNALLINARSETAAVRPAFAEAWAAHRCAIPASYYFEWTRQLLPDGRKKTGERYRIRPKGAEVIWLAGLYRLEDGLPRFTVLTREPREEIRFIHDRMPVILTADAAEAWIRPESDPAELLRSGPEEMEFEKG